MEKTNTRSIILPAIMVTIPRSPKAAGVQALSYTNVGTIPERTVLFEGLGPEALACGAGASLKPGRVERVLSNTVLLEEPGPEALACEAGASVKPGA